MTAEKTTTDVEPTGAEAPAEKTTAAKKPAAKKPAAKKPAAKKPAAKKPAAKKPAAKKPAAKKPAAEKSAAEKSAAKKSAAKKAAEEKPAVPTKPAKQPTTMIRITQMKSQIGFDSRQRRVLAGLGLGRIGRSVTRVDDDCIRGMVNKVSHLVAIEKMEG